MPLDIEDLKSKVRSVEILINGERSHTIESDAGRGRFGLSFTQRVTYVSGEVEESDVDPDSFERGYLVNYDNEICEFSTYPYFKPPAYVRFRTNWTEEERRCQIKFSKDVSIDENQIITVSAYLTLIQRPPHIGYANIKLWWNGLNKGDWINEQSLPYSSETYVVRVIADKVRIFGTGVSPYPIDQEVDVSSDASVQVSDLFNPIPDWINVTTAPRDKGYVFTLKENKGNFRKCRIEVKYSQLNGVIDLRQGKHPDYGAEWRDLRINNAPSPLVIKAPYEASSHRVDVTCSRYEDNRWQKSDNAYEDGVNPFDLVGLPDGISVVKKSGGGRIEIKPNNTPNEISATIPIEYRGLKGEIQVTQEAYPEEEVFKYTYRNANVKIDGQYRSEYTLPKVPAGVGSYPIPLTYDIQRMGIGNKGTETEWETIAVNTTGIKPIYGAYCSIEDAIGGVKIDFFKKNTSKTEERGGYFDVDDKNGVRLCRIHFTQDKADKLSYEFEIRNLKVNGQTLTPARYDHFRGDTITPPPNYALNVPADESIQELQITFDAYRRIHNITKGTQTEWEYDRSYVNRVNHFYPDNPINEWWSFSQEDMRFVIQENTTTKSRFAAIKLYAYIHYDTRSTGIVRVNITQAGVSAPETWRDEYEWRNLFIHGDNGPTHTLRLIYDSQQNIDRTFKVTAERYKRSVSSLGHSTEWVLDTTETHLEGAEVKSSAAWVIPVMDPNTHRLRINVARNYKTTERKAEVTLSYQGLTSKVLITQTGDPRNPNRTEYSDLRINREIPPLQIKAPKEAYEAPIKVTATGKEYVNGVVVQRPFEVDAFTLGEGKFTSSESWAKVEIDRVNKRFVLRLSANNSLSASSRTANIKVEFKDLSGYINISQQGGQISKETWTTEYKWGSLRFNRRTPPLENVYDAKPAYPSGDLIVTVTASRYKRQVSNLGNTTDWTIDQSGIVVTSQCSVSSTPSWLNVSVDGGVLRFRAHENTTTQTRSATVTISIGTLSGSVHLRQQPKQDAPPSDYTYILEHVVFSGVSVSYGASQSPTCVFTSSSYDTTVSVKYNIYRRTDERREWETVGASSEVTRVSVTETHNGRGWLSASVISAGISISVTRNSLTADRRGSIAVYGFKGIYLGTIYITQRGAESTSTFVPCAVNNDGYIGTQLENPQMSSVYGSSKYLVSGYHHIPARGVQRPYSGESAMDVARLVRGGDFYRYSVALMGYLDDKGFEKVEHRINFMLRQIGMLSDANHIGQTHTVASTCKITLDEALEVPPPIRSTVGSVSLIHPNPQVILEMIKIIEDEGGVVFLEINRWVEPPFEGDSFGTSSIEQHFKKAGGCVGGWRFKVDSSLITTSAVGDNTRRLPNQIDITGSDFGALKAEVYEDLRPISIGDILRIAGALMNVPYTRIDPKLSDVLGAVIEIEALGTPTNVYTLLEESLRSVGLTVWCNGTALIVESLHPHQRSGGFDFWNKSCVFWGMGEMEVLPSVPAFVVTFNEKTIQPEIPSPTIPMQTYRDCKWGGLGGYKRNVTEQWQLDEAIRGALFTDQTQNGFSYSTCIQRNILPSDCRAWMVPTAYMGHNHGYSYSKPSEKGTTFDYDRYMGVYLLDGRPAFRGYGDQSGLFRKNVIRVHLKNLRKNTRYRVEVKLSGVVGDGLVYRDDIIFGGRRKVANEREIVRELIDVLDGLAEEPFLRYSYELLQGDTSGCSLISVSDGERCIYGHPVTQWQERVYDNIVSKDGSEARTFVYTISTAEQANDSSASPLVDCWFEIAIKHPMKDNTSTRIKSTPLRFTEESKHHPLSFMWYGELHGSEQIQDTIRAIPVHTAVEVGEIQNIGDIFQPIYLDSNGGNHGSGGSHRRDRGSSLRSGGTTARDSGGVPYSPYGRRSGVPRGEGYGRSVYPAVGDHLKRSDNSDYSCVYFIKNMLNGIDDIEETGVIAIPRDLKYVRGNNLYGIESSVVSKNLKQLHGMLAYGGYAVSGRIRMDYLASQFITLQEPFALPPSILNKPEQFLFVGGYSLDLQSGIAEVTLVYPRTYTDDFQVEYGVWETIRRSAVKGCKSYPREMSDSDIKKLIGMSK